MGKGDSTSARGAGAWESVTTPAAYPGRHPAARKTWNRDCRKMRQAPGFHAPGREARDGHCGRGVARSHGDRRFHRAEGLRIDRSGWRKRANRCAADQGSASQAVKWREMRRRDSAGAANSCASGWRWNVIPAVRNGWSGLSARGCGPPGYRRLPRRSVRGGRWGSGESGGCRWARLRHARARKAEGFRDPAPFHSPSDACRREGRSRSAGSGLGPLPV